MKKQKLTPEQRSANIEARRAARAAAKEAARIEAEKNQKPVKQIKITIEWKKSRTWGSNPHLEARIEHWDGSFSYATATASGCGYDKESTVIADVFNQFLKYKLHKLPVENVANWGPGNPAKEPHLPYGIHNYNGHWSYGGGIGTNCYYAICEAIGGKFENVASGKTFDAYLYTDNQPAQ